MVVGVGGEPKSGETFDERSSSEKVLELQIGQRLSLLGSELQTRVLQQHLASPMSRMLIRSTISGSSRVLRNFQLSLLSECDQLNRANCRLLAPTFSNQASSYVKEEIKLAPQD